MLEKSFGLLFFLKQPKNQEGGIRYVYLRITVDGVSRELSTKRQWFAERWNQSIGRATGTKEDSKNLNAYLESLSAKIFQAKSSLLDSNRAITAEAIKNIVTGKSGERKLLLEIFQSHNDQIKALIGVDFSYRTLQRYRTAYDHAKAFIQWKYNTDDIEIRDLNYEFASDYSFWLKTVKNCAHNSSMKYISTIKTILLQCMRKGWLKYDPFMNFKTTQKEVTITPLSVEDLDTISNKKFSIERLVYVRDIFLFSCYTGLAYVDVCNLKRTQIITGIDGEKWITTQRQKTGTPTRLPLLPKAIEIMEKYDSHPKCRENNLLLPVLSNQKMNSYLKEIADTCEINKNLTFHIARHTFATTVTLCNGVPMETVSKMLGHKNIKQTQHYAKILDTKISEDMGRLRLKLEIK